MLASPWEIAAAALSSGEPTGKPPVPWYVVYLFWSRRIVELFASRMDEDRILRLLAEVNLRTGQLEAG